MSDQEQPQPQSVPPGAEQELSPEQEQMLRQMEEEMRRVTVQDLIAQSTVSILNLAYRRLAKEDERDLEQARAGIDAVRALVDQLTPEQQEEIRRALSQIQVAYAQLAGEEPPAGGGEPPAGGGGAPGPGAGGGGESGGGDGQRKPPPGLWVPGT
jgi:uncharacterized membrane protein YgcG